MTKILTFILILIVSGAALNAQTSSNTGRSFNINVPESKVEFFVGSSAGDVNGVFKTWTGKLSQTASGIPESSTLSLEVSAASMSTGSGLKDRMVKGKNFFFVKQFPTVSFNSTKVIPSSDPNKFQVEGNFTLRGVTKPVILQVTLDRDHKGNGQIYADLSFDRRDFGMTKGIPFVRVSDSVRVRVDLDVAPIPVTAATVRYSWSRPIRIKVNN
ncbi:MAG TPA: YceI family protein [Candidatus Acidoferrales bacterium]|jgi:polyisoprenoid-binding protein YceI